MKERNVTLLAVGDIRVDREDPDSIFAHVAPVIKQGDIAFAQLEAAYSERGACAVNLTPGFKASPRNVPAIAHAGFNIISVASNHSADYGPDAFCDTIDILRENKITVIGGGRNIDEARTPAIFKFDDTRVAFLAYNAILQPGYEARRDWPGMAPLRVKTFYEQVDWQPGTPPRIWTIPDAEDVRAILNDIRRTREKADIVVVSMHWGVHWLPDPAMYQTEVGHKVIDAGADLILGHHTHRLNPIEVYNGKVIFYGLGGFAFEVKVNREDPYAQVMRRFYLDQPPPNPAKEISRKHSVIVKCEISDKKLQKVSFRPTTANENAQPRVLSLAEKAGKEIVDYLTKSSAELNAKLTVLGDEVVIEGK